MAAENAPLLIARASSPDHQTLYDPTNPDPYADDDNMGAHDPSHGHVFAGSRIGYYAAATGMNWTALARGVKSQVDRLVHGDAETREAADSKSLTAKHTSTSYANTQAR